MKTIKQRVIRVIAEEVGVAPQYIETHFTFERELQCDSLDVIQIMLHLEDEFSIDVDQDEFEKLQTVQQAIAYVTGVCTEQREVTA